MRLAVFSDVHSNHHALKACLKEAEKQKADGYIFLGDYISDCANPHETMKLIYRAKQEMPCWFVRGNREEYVLNHHNFGSDWANGTTTGSLLYTYEGLTAEDLEFISVLPFMQTIDPNGKCPIRICHGSPEKTRDTLRPFSYKIESWLLKIVARVLLSGHTHQPCSAHTMGKLYVNPGAVGVQCTQTVTAKMALLDSDGNTWNETLLEVPYDIDAAALEIRESGLLTRAGVWGHVIIATHNAHKIEEFGRILAPLGITVQTTELTEAEETGTTFRENAYIKAKSACDETGLPCVADDSGLSIDYLNGEPGVYSARYAEPGKRKATVLKKLKGVPEEKRGAHFTSAICCVFPNGDVLEAEGYCYGRIAEECRGESGFGYDPIFICTEEGCAGKTFGEATAEEKDAVSHRGKSLRIFAEKLENYLKDKEG